MMVVSDTSCLSNLLAVGHETLLPLLFNEIVIPPAVEAELLRFHASLPAFLKRTAPADRARVSQLAREVDPGEAEAIVLAGELKADRLLIDERVGRAVALREGLSIIGLVGVLLAAKQKGLLPDLAPLLRRLESEAGFRMSQTLKAEILRAAAEA